MASNYNLYNNNKLGLLNLADFLCTQGAHWSVLNGKELHAERVAAKGTLEAALMPIQAHCGDGLWKENKAIRKKTCE